MAGRGSVLTILLKIFFATPFMAVGGFVFVAALTGDLTGNRPVAAVFGLIFFGTGAYHVVKAIRGRGSREAQGAPLHATAVLSDVQPQLTMDYRTAGRRTRSAAEVYAPVLDGAPLPRLKAKVGQTLPVALGVPPAKGAYGMLAFAIVWNVFVLPPFVGVAASRMWGPLAFLSLFVAAGGVLLITATKKLLSRLKLPRVEVSEDPVFLGDELRVHVEQRGPVRISRLRVDVVCRERASYTVGTDTRTEEHDAFRGELLDAPARKLGFGERWPHDLRVTLPAVAPHSFKSANNSVSWFVHVRAEIPGWPDYDELFELRALPRIPS